MIELMTKAEERTPYTVVALQEADRMNGLTNEMKLSLRELDLGLKVNHFFLYLCVFVKVEFDLKYLQNCISNCISKCRC